MAELESQLQSKCINLLHLRGLWVYHTHDSRRSAAGYPDLTIVGRRGVAFRELKKDGGRISAEQDQWIAALRLAGQDVGVWWPSDFPEEVDALARRLGGFPQQQP